MTLARPTLAYISKSWTTGKTDERLFISAEMRLRKVRYTTFSGPKISENIMEYLQVPQV
jgi:hypothetical protein